MTTLGSKQTFAALGVNDCIADEAVIFGGYTRKSVLSDEFEPVSVMPVTLSFIPCKVRATRQEQHCVSA